jgi:hypothetical protein
LKSFRMDWMSKWLGPEIRSMSSTYLVNNSVFV